MGWGAGARTPARLGHTLRGLLDVGGDRTGEAGSLAEPAGHLAALDGTNSVRQVSLQLSQSLKFSVNSVSAMANPSARLGNGQTGSLSEAPSLRRGEGRSRWRDPEKKEKGGQSGPLPDPDRSER